MKTTTKKDLFERYLAYYAQHASNEQELQLLLINQKFSNYYQREVHNTMDTKQYSKAIKANALKRNFKFPYIHKLN